MDSTDRKILSILQEDASLSVAEIARRLHNSELTVRTHLKRSYSKINVRTKEQLFAKLLRLTLLAPDIVEAVLDGRLPKGVRLEDLVRPLPSAWAEQRRELLGGDGG